MSTIDMEEELKKAQVLVEALPYIQKFSRKIIVVKYVEAPWLMKNLKERLFRM